MGRCAAWPAPGPTVASVIVPSGWTTSSREILSSAGSARRRSCSAARPRPAVSDSTRIRSPTCSSYGRESFFARAAVVDGQHVAFADPVFGHVRRAGVADVFALGELLPGDHAAGVPADFAAAAAGRAIDAPNRVRGGGSEALALADIGADDMLVRRLGEWETRRQGDLMNLVVSLSPTLLDFIPCRESTEQQRGRDQAGDCGEQTHFGDRASAHSVHRRGRHHQRAFGV